MRARRGPSHNGTTRRPSKKPRCEKKRGAKKTTGPGVGLAVEAHSGASTLDLEARVPNEENPQDGAQENTEPRRSEAFRPHWPQEGEEEEGDETASTSLQMEPEEASGQISEPDNSVFLDEDSNQPLPMDRFFGSMAFTQDPPPAASFSRSNTSRREFRRMHFIAKEEEEEESGEEVV
ncbi:UPF0688 protein C1orf174 homolog [Thamnophis elegans]|uniref:UPF0688 protein C1orf174 homolog n=1 Tax=Thamnophis elegans TaxID=35005 RepID=UPI0013777FAF|nr:UPF0688 protein C1orf174 homolog [Thamnophis elegans]